MSLRVNESGAPEKPPKSRKWVLIGAAVVLLLVGGMVGAVVFGGQLQDDQGADATSPSTTDDAASDDAHGSDDRPAAEGGLTYGDATGSLSRSTTQVAYAQRGFPHTTAGAVEAATAEGQALHEMPTHTDADAKKVASDVFMKGQSGLLKVLPGTREYQGLLPNGSFPNLEPGERYYSSCLPEFGAYRTRKVTESSVTVDVWMPCIFGPGSPNSVGRLHVLWADSSMDMAWADGDWRDTALPGAGDREEKRLPSNIDRPDVSFAERAQLLGDDWKLYADATEEWPTDLLGASPEAFG